MNPSYQDKVLPGQGSVCLAGYQDPKQAKPDFDCPHSYQEALEFLMSEFSDQSSSQYTSPPISPTHWESPLFSPELSIPVFAEGYSSYASPPISPIHCDSPLCSLLTKPIELILKQEEEEEEIDVRVR